MYIDLGKLDYKFLHKPLLIGGKAMEYYGLRKSGQDIDFVYIRRGPFETSSKYPNNIKTYMVTLEYASLNLKYGTRYVHLIIII